MLLPQKRLRQLLGVLWLIDGLLQLQPLMFTMNMVNGVMVPTVHNQPAPIAASLQWIIAVTTHNLALVNLLIAGVQIAIGILLISGLWVRGTIIASIVWALIVWYGGEGMSMLLTGQASILTGAPGAVLLYPLLGLLVYPRKEDQEQGLIPRSAFRWILAGFWFFSALLQLQPYWWQQGQISQTIGGMVGQGGLNGFLVDPLLQRLSDVTAHSEVLLNSILIVVCLALGLALLFVKEKQLRPVLIASIIVSFVIWWAAEGFGMIFTGMATDFNSGLLLVVMALACWPKASLQGEAEQQSTRDVQPSKSSVQPV
ncbi:MAG: hypothetical protein JO011_00540 [Ktedonobacteraceae bacterium]|nr:hypothetical protein [Ktedonobacteraceae bacterium]